MFITVATALIPELVWIIAANACVHAAHDIGLLNVKAGLDCPKPARNRLIRNRLLLLQLNFLRGCVPQIHSLAFQLLQLCNVFLQDGLTAFHNLAAADA